MKRAKQRVKSRHLTYLEVCRTASVVNLAEGRQYNLGPTYFHSHLVQLCPAPCVLPTFIMNFDAVATAPGATSLPSASPAGAGMGMGFTLEWLGISYIYGQFFGGMHTIFLV